MASKPKKISVAPYLEPWRVELLTSVAARVREIRLLRGVSLTALSKDIGTHLSQLSRFEAGKANIRIELLDRIACRLQVDPYEFFVPDDKSEVRGAQAIGREAPPIHMHESGRLLSMVGSRIREFREMQGLSPSALGDLIDSNGRHLGNIEEGQVNLSLVVADRIARGLRVDLHEFFVPVEKSDVLRRQDAPEPVKKGRKRAG